MRQRSPSSVSRRRVLQAGSGLFVSRSAIVAALAGTREQEQPRDEPPLIQAPMDRADWRYWRDKLVAWRTAVRLGYDGSAYDLPVFAWTQTCYCCTKVMTWDKRFLNHATGEYHVDAIVRDGQRRFGGFDAVVLWHAYPRIGFDDRNQFDYYKELPEGLAGLRTVVDRFHSHGMRVFIDYNPWDTGTRRTGLTDAVACASLVAAIDGDGILLDTLNEGTAAMRAAADAAKPGIALESELALPISGLATNHLSWAQWFDSLQAPGLLRNRWVEQRHMMHLIRRWDPSHAGEMQLAWMNGAGMLVWENIFGSWNGWSERDQAMLRRLLPVQRHFTQHFTYGEWTPMTPTLVDGVFASQWTLPGVRLWTAANRVSQAASGRLFDIDLAPGERLFDVFTGREVRSASGEIAPNGIAGYVATVAGALNHELERFLAAQRRTKKLFGRPGRPIAPVPVGPNGGDRVLSAAPEGSIEVAAAEHTIVTKFRQRECGERSYAPAGGPSELHAEFDERRTLELGRFAVMRRGVTNGEFAEFIAATDYRPKRDENFLHHFENGQPKARTESLPVCYVNLADARAYAAWKRWRLPTDAEWQIALTADPAPLEDHPLWNWTASEYDDGRTRYCILKGGAPWKAVGSDWYADSGPHEPEYAAKFIEIWAGLDRCATVGFRCAVSLT